MDLSAKELQDLEFAQCAKDFWYFAKFLQTFDEERELRRPFPDPEKFPYLHRIDKEMEEHTRVVFLKPRRMLVSLLTIARMMHKAKFAGTGVEGTREIYYGGYSAIDEDLAQYQMARIQQMHDDLPLWLKDRNPLVKTNQLVKQFQCGGLIKGFPLKREGAQGYGFSEFIFDEAAWQEAAASTYKGLRPTIGDGRFVIISTPNGDEGIGEFFYNVWHYKNGKYKEFHHIEIDWWDNPEHDQDWFNRQSADLQPWEVAQMFEKSFAVVSGDPVYPEFSKTGHVAKKEEPILLLENQPMYWGWDFGYDNPAAVLAQRNSRDQWLIHREFIKRNIDFAEFCKFVREFADTLYDRKKCPEIHCIDPAGMQTYHQKGQSGAVSDAHEIDIQWDRRRYDGTRAKIYPGPVQVGTRHHEGVRIKDLRHLLKLRDDTRYGIVFDPACETIIDGLAGSYVRTKTGEPLKNRVSHPIDALQYIISVYERMLNPRHYDSHRKGKSTLPQRLSSRIGM